MITQFGCTNFKSWEALGSVRLAPITGLFGANSSGKSSLLQLLLLLKQTVESPDRAAALHFGDDRDYVALGSFGEVVWNHDTARPLRLSLSWEMKDELKVSDPEAPREYLLRGRGVDFEVSLGVNGSGAPSVERMHYRFGGQEFTMVRSASGGNGFELTTIGDHMQLKRSVGRPTRLPAPIKCYGFPDGVRGAYQNVEFLTDLELALAQQFRNLYYLGPLREHPHRQYTWAGSQPEDVGRRGERAVEALLSARERGLTVQPGRGRRSKPLEAYIAERLRDLGLVHGFAVEAVARGSDIYRVWVEVRAGAPRVLLTDVGFGVSQVLPVVVLCYYAPEGSTIVLEQPEIHLHPTVQSGLADILIDAMKARRIQVIVESHSEHLLRRLQRRIAEEHQRTAKDDKFTAQRCALYFCRPGDGGTAMLEPLQLDLLGNITNWPDGFFGDDFGEIKAMQDAQLRRRREAAL